MTFRERIERFEKQNQEAMESGWIWQHPHQDKIFFATFALLVASYFFRVPEFPYLWLGWAVNHYGGTAVVAAAFSLLFGPMFISIYVWFAEGLFPEYKRVLRATQYLLTVAMSIGAFLIGILSPLIFKIMSGFWGKRRSRAIGEPPTQIGCRATPPISIKYSILSYERLQLSCH